MCTSFLVLALLLCACHSLHVQRSSNREQDGSYGEHWDSPDQSIGSRLYEGQAGAINPLKALAIFLLAFNPVLGFDIRAAGTARRFLMHSESSSVGRLPSSEDLSRVQGVRRPMERSRPTVVMNQNGVVNATVSSANAMVASASTMVDNADTEADNLSALAVDTATEVGTDEFVSSESLGIHGRTGNANASKLDNTTVQEVLDLEKVAEILKGDIPKLLSRETKPNWDVYAPDFYVKSSTEGIGVLRFVSKLLQERNRSFEVKEDVQVEFINGRTLDEPCDPICKARWKVEMNRPYYGIGMRDDPIVLEAETIFHLNDNNQVDYVQICNLVVDRRKILSWPTVKVVDDPAIILEKVKEKVTNATEIPDLDEFLSLRKVVETLKADIPKLLRKEPDWSIYSDDFSVRSSREGLAILKLLASLLKSRDKKLVVTEDIQVEFNDGRWKVERDGRPFDPYLIARWKLNLERPFNSFERMLRFITRPTSAYYRDSSECSIEGETIFHLNEKNKVDYVLIDELIVDGRKIFQWPRVELADDPAKILESLKAQVDAPMFDPLQKLQEWAGNLRDLDLSAGSVIRAWKSIARQSQATAKTEIQCDDRRKKVIKKIAGTERILTQLADDLEWATPDEILGLVGKQGSSEDALVDVSALASVTQTSIIDETGKLAELAETLGIKEAGEDLYAGGFVPVVEIGEVVAVPTAGSSGGVGVELLLQIVGRAAVSGRLVVLTPANDKLEKYYRKIGFELIDDFGRTMVYTKPLEDVADNEFKFEMGTLRVS